MRGHVAIAVAFLTLSCSGSREDVAVHGRIEAFGLGREPSLEEIEKWDIDVMPDGTGLPPGSGTVEQGAELYAGKCASCHGATGTEGPYDRLVGRVVDDEFPFGRDPSVRSTIGNYWPYATTLYDYVYRTMPFGTPGTLAPDEVYGLVAVLLFMNGIVPEDAVMNAQTLPMVMMPARDRLVEDDRRGGGAGAGGAEIR